MITRFKEFKKLKDINEAVDYHISNDLPLSQNVFRLHSENFYELFRKFKELHESNSLHMNLSEFDKELLQTDIGYFGEYEGQQAPLDIPIAEESEGVELNKPARGGPKKFYVFVRDPSTKNVKKVTFGDTTGLSAKINNPEARKSFAARHRCSQQNDKTSAAYWACRLPYYAKELGLSGGGNFFW